MNFQCKSFKKPIKVIFINPLELTSRLIIMKIMSGVVFGSDQPVDLILIVYINDIDAAKLFKLDLQSCGFSYTNSINISSELPSVSDGDVFCFVSDLCNPNIIDINTEEPNKQFDALYLLLKVARNFSWNKEVKKPIFISDGLVGIDILKSFSLNMPHDIFFCPSPLTAIAKYVLADILQVGCTSINNISIWASNEEVFYTEIDKPIIIHDEIDRNSNCTWDMIGRRMLNKLEYDSTQFSASWLKKEFIEKISTHLKRNMCSCIHRAIEFAETLKDIWEMRKQEGGESKNIGVISDGSLGTLKGYPYVLPIIFSGNTRVTSRRFEDDINLKQEIKRMNKTSRLQHAEVKYHPHLI